MFFVIEIQRQHDGTAAHIMQTAATREQAEAIFHGILQFAATSTLAAHSAAILSDEANLVKRECYYHAAPAPEPEPEPDPEGEETPEPDPEGPVE